MAYCLGLTYQKRGNIFTSNLSTLAITVSAKVGTKYQKYLCLPVKGTMWLRIVLLLSKYAAIFSVTLTPQNVSISSTAYQLNVSKLYRTIKGELLNRAKKVTYTYQNSLGRIMAMPHWQSWHCVTTPEAVSLLKVLLLWATLTSNFHS